MSDLPGSGDSVPPPATDQPKPAPSAPETSTAQASTEPSSPLPRSSTAASFADLSTPQKMVGVGAGAALLLGFMSWLSFGGAPITGQMGALSDAFSINGFRPWYGKLFFVAALAAALFALVPAIRDMVFAGKPQRTFALTLLALTAGAFLFGPLWFLLDVPTGSAAGMFKLSRTMWFWLALVASGIAVFGAFKLLGESDPA